MYDSTSEKLSYIKRVASHATKPRPSGRIDDIPEWADGVDINSLMEMYQTLMKMPLENLRQDSKLNRKIFKARYYEQIGDSAKAEHFKRMWFGETLRKMKNEEVQRQRIEKYGTKPKSGWPKKAPRIRTLVFK